MVNYARTISAAQCQQRIQTKLNSLTKMNYFQQSAPNNSSKINEIDLLSLRVDDKQKPLVD